MDAQVVVAQEKYRAMKNMVLLHAVCSVKFLTLAIVSHPRHVQ